jgi:hypothetical protein
MSDKLAAPFHYRIAQSDKRTAYERYNYAASALELAQIKERFAEVYSQYDPVNKVSNMRYDDRDMLCAIAHYVVVGRLPEEDK